MNEIETRTLEKELSYKDTVILKYKIEYPEIVKSEFEFGTIAFNNYNRRKANELRNYAERELFREARETYDYNEQNGFPVMVYEVDLSYTVTFNENAVVSLYTDQYIFSGGAHGSTIREAQNWNLRMGKRIPLSFFFLNNPYYMVDILKEINTQIQTQIEDGTNQYFDDYCQLVLQTFNPQNFYIGKDTLTIFFQQYDIAPYSSGIPTFELLR